MVPKGRRTPNFSGLAPAAIAGVALSLFILWFPAEEKFRAKSINRKISVESIEGLNQASRDSSSAILLDSIVSLVQSYYVDTDRVTGDHLIAGTMRSLAYAIPELRFVESESSYSISGRSEKLEFNHGEDMEYEEVLGHLKSLISFCSRIKISELMDQGENIMLGSERDSTSIVLNALLSSLDAHSSLMSKDAYQELRQGTEGAFGGLGVLVGMRESILTVLKPLPKSPAVKLGIQKHDKIISIDGFNTFGLTLDKLVGHMRGEPGTQAQLVTLRPGAWSPRVINLKREVIEVDSVEAFEHHNNDLHVLRLVVENFASRTSKEIIEQVRRFRRKYSVGGVVLDLRGNPGGLLDQAVLVSDIFMDQGIVVTTRGRREEIERATRSFDEVNFPLAVLMDEDSASASEIVAGALQDNGRAIVIGQPSFGKGSVQTVFELPEQRALKLTIARYFTPAHKSIQNVGIIPDVWIQPVIKSKDNTNLFGPYRYRNEQFLPNHLSAVASAANLEVPTAKGYFLSNSSRDESSEHFDPEMDTAMAIFAKTKEAYGNTLPEAARRSSHWLALAMPVIKDKLVSMSKDSIKWLHDNQNVTWKLDLQRHLEKPSLALQIKASSEGLVAIAGGTVAIPWRVTNLGLWDAENVSVFVQSPISGLETREVLVGVVPAGQSREGNLKVTIPRSMSAGRHYVNAGIAIDAQALVNAQGEFLVNISEKSRSNLNAQINFVDGEFSHLAGVLEPQEKGSIRVKITNSSDQDAKGVKVTLFSFGGEQVHLQQSAYQVSEVSAGSSSDIIIPIQAKDRIDTSAISVGVSVSATSDFDTYYTVLELATKGPVASSRDLEKLSH